MQHRLTAVGAVLTRAAQDAGAHQREKAVHQHLGAAVEADREGASSASAGNGAPSLASSALKSALAHAADQGVRQGIGERADADLQRPAVLDERRRVQRHRVVGKRDRFLRRREQLVVRALRLKHDVALADIHLGRARHIRQVGIDLDGERERLARLPPSLDVGHHVERDVGVGAEADAGLALRVRRHQLAEHVGADARKVPRHLRIVEAGIASLHAGVGKPGAGLQEELGDLDVGRQAPAAQGLGVVEVGVAAAQPVEQGLNEAPLQAGAVGRAHRLSPVKMRRRMRRSASASL